VNVQKAEADVKKFEGADTGKPLVP
jgi:hypothetical protein